MKMTMMTMRENVESGGKQGKQTRYINVSCVVPLSSPFRSFHPLQAYDNQGWPSLPRWSRPLSPASGYERDCDQICEGHHPGESGLKDEQADKDAYINRWRSRSRAG